MRADSSDTSYSLSVREMDLDKDVIGLLVEDQFTGQMLEGLQKGTSRTSYGDQTSVDSQGTTLRNSDGVRGTD